ncbi:MAG: shikimate dehydrogenase [Clostridia bacterium]|nr:shikimate dehydrogenase [Clostridia bacterium]
MLHFGLIGEHLGHSMSVPIHQALYRLLGIEADYQLYELPRDTFKQDAEKLLHTLDGFNITIPYKQDIMPLLKSIDPFAQAIGAVNTVRCKDASGYNTDAPGFAAMLRRHGIDPAGKPAFVLGTGGAAKAIVAALQNMGAISVTCVSRHPKGGDITYEQLADDFSGVLVNCTPVGMWPNVDGCPIPGHQLKDILRRAAGVADVIYNPAETVLTKAAAAAGVPACTGLYMLVDQAVEAERRWLDCPIPADMTATIMKEMTTR